MQFIFVWFFQSPIVSRTAAIRFELGFNWDRVSHMCFCCLPLQISGDWLCVRVCALYVYVSEMPCDRSSEPCECDNLMLNTRTILFDFGKFRMYLRSIYFRSFHSMCTVRSHTQVPSDTRSSAHCRVPTLNKFKVNEIFQMRFESVEHTAYIAHRMNEKCMNGARFTISRGSLLSLLNSMRARCG